MNMKKTNSRRRLSVVIIVPNWSRYPLPYCPLTFILTAVLDPVLFSSVYIQIAILDRRSLFTSPFLKHTFVAEESQLWVSSRADQGAPLISTYPLK